MFKILIVDNEKGHRSALVKMLYSIYPEDIFLEAESGEQALDVMQLMECDIVITDIRMGGMSGLELLKSIRNRFGDIAVIILSGYGEFEYAREAIMYGAADYLLKPVDTEEFGIFYEYGRFLISLKWVILIKPGSGKRMNSFICDLVCIQSSIFCDIWSYYIYSSNYYLKNYKKIEYC